MKLNPIGSNQIELEIGGNIVFFSYKTPVCAYLRSEGKWIRTEKFHSITTAKHMNKYLRGRSFILVPQQDLDNLVIDI